jgi:hypothetical protein
VESTAIFFDNFMEHGMATGLDLNGLNGLTFDAGDVSLVTATQSAGGAFNVTAANTPGTNFAGAAGASSPMTFHVEGNVNNSAQSLSRSPFIEFNLPGNSYPAVNANMKLVGWNADGLLFSGASGGEFLFIADPNAPSTPISSSGMPEDTAFTANSSVPPPFGLSPITIACFATGTHIRTPRGETGVEALKVGDSVLTLSGVEQVVKWVGERRVNCRRHPRPNEVMPVRIKANAFGENLPLRDLLVSPGHSLYVDGVLIPAGFLVNGATVVQEEVEHIHYHHIELDAHDVVLAEGLPAESYLDDENRHAFNNAGEFAALHPDLDPKSWENACAPRVMAGPQLTEVRQRLIDQADGLGYHVIDDTDVHLLADGERIEPCHTVGERHWFIVPAGSREVRLNSNSGVPMQLIADHGDDRRLGIAVSEFKLDGAACELGQVFASNPYPLESHNDLSWVWTDGSVPLGLAVPADTPTMVELAVLMSMKSWSRKPNLSIVRPLETARQG